MGRALARGLDAALEAAVVSFACWTVLYHLTGVVRLPGDLVWWVWCVLTVVAVAAWSRLRRRWSTAGPSAHHVPAALVGVGAAVLAALVVRTDLDDASYVVRSRAVQESGRLHHSDVIFGEGWPALVGQDPYLPSFEAFWGMAGRVLGVQGASLLYLVHVPLATFAATWALWTLLRAWRVRRPLAGLLLGGAFLLLGGDVHASWGNLHLARMWQGKVVLLAVLVPLMYAWAAQLWHARRGSRWGPLTLVAAGSVAAVGLSPVATFVVPSVVVTAAVVGAVTRRWARAATLVVAGCAYPVAAGVLTRLGGNLPGGPGSSEPLVVSSTVNAWQHTVGTGWAAVVVAVAGLAAAAGAIAPAAARAHGRVAPVTAGATVAAGSLVLVPPLWDAAVGIMGTDAVAWRLVWVVPVPALVAMLASPARREPVTVVPAVAAATAAVLVVGGTPLWAASNGAHLTTRPVWKMPPDDLAAGRWIAGRPAEGRYLAATSVVAAVGSTSASHRPVGSRADYLHSYTAVPGARVAERWVLQQWVEGLALPDPAAVADALDLLDVRTVCLRSDLVQGYLPAGTWNESAQHGTLVCLTRG